MIIATAFFFDQCVPHARTPHNTTKMIQPKTRIIREPTTLTIPRIDVNSLTTHKSSVRSAEAERPMANRLATGGIVLTDSALDSGGKYLRLRVRWEVRHAIP